MKRFFTLFAISCFCINMQAQISENMTLLGQWDDDDLPTHFFGTFNDIWGYTADDREYAIMGSAEFYHFLDVTDPSNIVEIAKLPGGEGTVWRDIKTYQDKAYAVSDGTNEGLMVFDLSDLPNSVTMVLQDNSNFGSSHNIFIDVPNGKLYVGGMNNPDLIIYDLTANPAVPVLLASHDLPGGGYMHDLYIRDNIGYFSHETRGFYVWDLNDVTNPIMMANVETNGYNHSNWVTDDGNYAIMAEEVPTGLPLGVADLTDLANGNIEVPLYFKDPLITVAAGETDATPHNPFILGNHLITSYYEDGIIVHDITDPLNPVRVAHYDTHPENTNYNGYRGCWGTYPYLPSGNILASDFDYGLHVLSLDLVLSNEDLPNHLESFVVSPNPASDELTVTFSTNELADVQLNVINLTGQVLTTKQYQVNGVHTDRLNVNDFPAGIYFVQISDGSGQSVRKIIVE